MLLWREPGQGCAGRLWTEPWECGPRPHRQHLAWGLRMCVPLTQALEADRGLDPARGPRSPVCETGPLGPSLGEASGLLPAVGSQLASRPEGGGAGGGLWGREQWRGFGVWQAAGAVPSEGASSICGFCLLTVMSFQCAGSVRRSWRARGLTVPHELRACGVSRAPSALRRDGTE